MLERKEGKWRIWIAFWTKFGVHLTQAYTMIWTNVVRVKSYGPIPVETVNW